MYFWFSRSDGEGLGSGLVFPEKKGMKISMFLALDSIVRWFCLYDFEMMCYMCLVWKFYVWDIVLQCCDHAHACKRRKQSGSYRDDIKSYLAIRQYESFNSVASLVRKLFNSRMSGSFPLLLLRLFFFLCFLSPEIFLVFQPKVSLTLSVLFIFIIIIISQLVLFS